jgi:hypothetical protein
MTLITICVVMVICFILAIGFFIDGAITAGDGNEKLADKKAVIYSVEYEVLEYV